MYIFLPGECWKCNTGTQTQSQGLGEVSEKWQIYRWRSWYPQGSSILLFAIIVKCCVGKIHCQVLVVQQRLVSTHTFLSTFLWTWLFAGFPTGLWAVQICVELKLSIGRGEAAHFLSKPQGSYFNITCPFLLIQGGAQEKVTFLVRSKKSLEKELPPLCPYSF